MKDSNDEYTEVTNEFLLTQGRFNSPDDFSIFIEQESVRRKIPYFEVLCEFCEQNDIEPESIAKSITVSLKQKIQADAEQLNLLKTKSVSLPK